MGTQIHPPNPISVGPTPGPHLFVASVSPCARTRSSSPNADAPSSDLECGLLQAVDAAETPSTPWRRRTRLLQAIRAIEMLSMPWRRCTWPPPSRPRRGDDERGLLRPQARPPTSDPADLAAMDLAAGPLPSRPQLPPPPMGAGSGRPPPPLTVPSAPQLPPPRLQRLRCALVA